MEIRNVRYLAGGRVVTRHNTIGTSFVVFTALELDVVPSGAFHNHTTLQFIDGMWFGTIDSRMLPEEINKLPVGEARFKHVDTLHKQHVAEAHAMILEAWPEIKRYDYARIGATLEVHDHRLANEVRFGPISQGSAN